MANPAIDERRNPNTPAGEGRSLWRTTLEAGASLLQDMTPLKDFDICVVGLHCAKDVPRMQMEAHHYCHQVNQDLLQCTIFDGNTVEANLIGIEYIISKRLFDSLSEDEKAYWHLNSHGKIWHSWHTGQHDGEPGDGDSLPLGEAKLMWSFNRDGEADEAGRDAMADQFEGTRALPGVIDATPGNSR